MSGVLSNDKKLSVLYRLEPGCLGPQGKGLIDEFCNFAHTQLDSLESHAIALNIIPRHDKTLNEMQCILAGNNISHTQAKKYLNLLKIDLDEFENNLDDKLETLITEFMNKKH
ncbi:hypothetical protein [Marinicellulosiphila megalodicopiae]|uniref:hypothetical protein n=1 Tax=Marinicellulosiphila megalodicopiae TaxID=2724896 RepID=UPI003BB1007A